jgi:hypothetical protein
MLGKLELHKLCPELSSGDGSVCPMPKLPPKLDNKYKETKAAELLTHHGKTTAGIIGMGRVLTEVKEALPHGEYTEWMSRNFKFSNATSLRYRRSFAFATSTDDFGSVKLETMALYFCAERHDKISKPIHKDHHTHAAIQAGLKAVLTAARERLIDEDDARRIYFDAVTSKRAEQQATKTAAKKESADKVTERMAAHKQKYPDSLWQADTREREVRTSTPETSRPAASRPAASTPGPSRPAEREAPTPDASAPAELEASEPDQSEADATADTIQSDADDPRLAALVPAARQFPEAFQMVMQEQSDDHWLEQAKIIAETKFRKLAAHVNAALKTFDATGSVVKLKADRAEAKVKRNT